MVYAYVIFTIFYSVFLSNYLCHLPHINKFESNWVAASLKVIQ